MVPDLVFDVQAHEPAVQQVVVDRLDQLALAADGEQDLQQQGLEQHLGRHRGAPAAGIHRFELAVHRRQQRIDHGAQLAQRVCRWHALFKADVAEHRPLEVLVASHLSCLGRSWMASDRSGPHGRRRRIFQRPVSDFAEVWFVEAEVTWRRSYSITQRGALDKYLIPFFGDKEVGQITKADVLAFRASLAKVPARKSSNTLSNRRINSIMKPLRQILNEAADRFEFTSAFRNIKPLKMKRSDVMPFTLEDVQRILSTARADYRNYFTVRFFTGMRTGEVHGLKWKYIDFERRLILVRESIVLNEEDELKTDGSMRDIQMNEMVFDALQAQFKTRHPDSEYVFSLRSGKPIDNQNFLNRVWAPLLRHLGLEHRRAYQMRHTAATLWLAAGEAPEWIARQLGHTSTEMLFRVYSRYVPNLTRRDGSAMERLLKQHISLAPVTGNVTPVILALEASPAVATTT